MRTIFPSLSIVAFVSLIIFFLKFDFFEKKEESKFTIETSSESSVISPHSIHSNINKVNEDIEPFPIARPAQQNVSFVSSQNPEQENPNTNQESLWKAMSEARRMVYPLTENHKKQVAENIGYELYGYNPKNKLRARFGKGGMRLDLNDVNPVSILMQLSKINGKSVLRNEIPQQVEGEITRVEYDHAQGLKEWYVNREEGIEHGFILESRPLAAAAGEPVRIEISVDGLVARASNQQDGDLVLMKGDETYFQYSKLKVYDAEKNRIPSQMLGTAEGNILISYQDDGVKYPVTVDPLITTQEDKITADDSAWGDNFGRRVSLSNNTALVGAYVDDDAGSASGSAYIFERDGANWNFQAKLTASDAAAGDRFGVSVAVSGDTALVGAYSEDEGGSNSGSAYVFERNGTSWSEQVKLVASDSIVDANFGWSVALAGDTALIGANGDDGGAINSGSAYIFERSEGGWNEQAKLTASDADPHDSFGWSVSISGDTALISAYSEDEGGSNSGSAYVFVRNEGNWNEQAKLTASDAATLDLFGWSASLSGDTAMVGAIFNDDDGNDSGSVYVFERSGESWSEQIKLTASDAAALENFGTSVSISGNRAIIGAEGDDGAVDTGSAYIFERIGGSWIEQVKLISSDAAANDNFGISVSLSGDTALMGANGNGVGGAAYIFEYDGLSWSEQEKLTASDAGANKNFGYSVSLSGETALIGVNADDVGTESGSAYVFQRGELGWNLQAKLTPSDAGSHDRFGHSVSLTGDVALIGSPLGDGEDALSGKAYVFQRSGNTWSEQATLTASDGSYIDRFGWSVSLSGNTALIGAYFEDENGFNSGSAYIFERSGSIWSELEKLTASDADANDNFGISVSLSGDTALIGAISNDDDGDSSGSAYIFERSGNTWSEQVKLIASGADGNDNFGVSVSLSGDTALIGANGDEDALGTASGAAYIFERSGNLWSEQAKLTPSDAAIFDNFGISVSLSGDTALIGADLNDDDGIGSGSAYIFERSGISWNEEMKLTASDAAASDRFGQSVSLSGDTALIGSVFDDDDGNGSGSAYFFRINNNGVRDLYLTDHDNLEVLTNGAATAFDGLVIGGNTSYTFSLHNRGTIDLDLFSISILGVDADQFSFSAPDISGSSDIIPSESLVMTVSFNPSGTDSGFRNAQIVISSNDPTPVYLVNISGLALSDTLDADGDGASDWAEYRSRQFGFDWQVAQEDLVSDFYDVADSFGLFLASEIGEVQGEFTIAGVNTTTGTATLKMILEQGTDLSSLNKINVNPSNLSVNSDGDIEFELESLEAIQFFRAGWK